MDRRIQTAFIVGVERLSAWANLLDAINVFPVADADTGRNLLLSLIPLRQLNGDVSVTIQRLLHSARGNSGNIAMPFICSLLGIRKMADLPRAARKGYEDALSSVARPEPGTMLSVFEALADTLEKYDPEAHIGNFMSLNPIIDHLANVVRMGQDKLPALRDYGVVDSGALGMFLFLEGFLGRLEGETLHFPPLTERFTGLLSISGQKDLSGHDGHCISAMIRLDSDKAPESSRMDGWGESMVVSKDRDCIKIHLHASDSEKIRGKLSGLGEIVQWSEESLELSKNVAKDKKVPAVHIVTDGAGSVTGRMARDLNVTLLDSYVAIGNQFAPETHIQPSELYHAMRRGVRVSTSQASVFERHQHYQSLLERHGQVLYLCVGSVYTGNYDTVTSWKSRNDPENRLHIIDTGAASGRLGTVCIATARYACRASDVASVVRFAEKAIANCEEYIFVDRLDWLAAGGRLSKTSAFFGNLLHLKPVVSPTAKGPVKTGLVKSRKEQLSFFSEKLKRYRKNSKSGLIMLQYSDNEQWVREHALEIAKTMAPEMEILVNPLSRTSGAHMGPGTWAVAMLSTPEPPCIL